MRGYQEIVCAGAPKRVLNWAASLLSARAPYRFAPGVEYILRNTGKQDLECVATFTPDAESEYSRARTRAVDAGILVSTTEMPGDCEGLNSDGWSVKEVSP
jgi:hypothetical protein